MTDRMQLEEYRLEMIEALRAYIEYPESRVDQRIALWNSYAFKLDRFLRIKLSIARKMAH